jgi:hypothetical protein
MITANELRIGNLVKWEEYILPIKSIDYESVYVKLNEELRIIYKTKYLYLFINELESVPLTEERLLKFGFESKDGYLELYIHENLSIIYVGYLALFINGVMIQINNTDSDKVHQLQNLYFALKGEELTIKEDK